MMRVARIRITISALLLMLFMVVSIAAPQAMAFDPYDVKYLRDTGSCPDCDLSGAYLRVPGIGNSPPTVTDLVNSALDPDLAGANLKGADLSGADLSGVNLEGANLSGAKFINTLAPDANFREANLTGAQLRGAILYNTDLSGAILDKADLENVNLVGARLSGVSLNDANFYRTDLRYTDLTGAKKAMFWGGERRDLDYVDLCKARMPSGRRVSYDCALLKWNSAIFKTKERIRLLAR